MDNDLIDRVAVAIIDAAQKGARGKPRELARAAIEAMREPTDLMGNGLPAGYRPGSHSATQIWQAMIDAALTESPSHDG